ncbi:MerR HTH family regulatory protein [Halopseudomonas sabulinigri]|uniref:MerR HTH family regulatory protein n=1 Tax=Halopseudomonas sabulinigri TaxID=472181 RepID=A0A1H1WBH2_9GAMM|nr:MerR family transcriptional regulator [Halopseudomonas sabulinigri]SDS94000.1 MerR HTH family regulatory protein [Halopseudomonas sabulinigri]
MHTQEASLLPIREVARATGVNPVTLRAWERRYGLVKPHRTPKGHRLYAPEQLQQIQQILTWLERGVAISQVAALVREQVEPAPSLERASLWQHQSDTLLFSLARFDNRQLAAQYRDLMGLYPAPLVCAQLLEPVLAELEQRPASQYGNQLEKQFLHSWLHSQMAARLAMQQEQAQGPRLLLANISGTSHEPRLDLLSLLFSDAGFRLLRLEVCPPASELTLLHERRPLDAMLLVGSQRLDPTTLERDLPRLAGQVSCPLFAAGPIVQLHAGDLRDAGITLLSSSPALSFEQLQQALAGDAA